MRQLFNVSMKIIDPLAHSLIEKNVYYGNF
jgi:hypothetical protein